MEKINGTKPRSLQHKYPSHLEASAIQIAEDFRKIMDLASNQKRGRRFNSNEELLGRLRSWLTPQEFNEKPGTSVIEALRDCASADHWYDHEKDWGRPEQEEDHQATEIEGEEE